MSEPPPPFQPSPIEPLRVETLQYHTAMTGPPRPGVVVAVGVISIVLGCIGVLASCGGIFTGSRPTNMRVIMTATPSSTASNGSGNSASNGPTMMSDEHRQMAIRGLDRSGALTPARRAMLDKLLASTGDKVFPFAESVMSEQRVAASVSQTGRVPGATGAADDYFILASGRVEVGDDHASFSSNTRGEQTVTVSNDDPAQPAANPSGRMVMVPTFTTTPVASTRPYAVYAFTSAVELVLAVYLIIAGIRTLAGSMRARQFHLWYVMLKLPVIIVATIAYSFIAEDRFGGMPISGAALSGMAMVMTAFQFIFAMIYPIALLIVMNVGSVKDYYRVARPAEAAA